ncbi:MAG TPA: LuxR C-terminal-related transcriptional regulator [Bradyrhizobium sp.]|jgi:DNA-binding NarL/FixJ family response regulator|nr:LuxR C-terminal-related transcriptional regulator [Bradyrhizobium sp.]
MSQQENRISDSPFSKWIEDNTPLHDDPEMVRPAVERARAMDEASAEIARQLNGPLTALLLYMGEIKQHSHQISQAGGNRAYLQQVVDNALQQTERVCAIVKQMRNGLEGPAIPSARKAGWEKPAAHAKDVTRLPGVVLSSGADQKPLTRREREVLSLISEGCSNKQGALRMQISPRTFESHRAVAMRKLGARNTADLVRLALLHSAG